MKKILYITVGPFYLLLCVAAIFVGRMRRSNSQRVIFGVSPLISNMYWCRALRQSGIDARTWMTSTPNILDRGSFDVDFGRRYRGLAPIAMGAFFVRALARPSTIFTTCEGFLLGPSVFWRLEAHLLRASGSKVVVITYGADSYVYRDVRSLLTQQVLQFSYPDAARKQDRISARVRYWTRNADVFISGLMYPDGFGRSDVVTPNPFCLDLEEWTKPENCPRSGSSTNVVVTHAPNHRGFKGTEFLIRAVQNLRDEGLAIELRLLERVPNAEVKRVLLTESDIHVEQLVCDGYAFNAIEAMAAGLPVISNLSNTEMTRPLKLWSFLGECPIVSASPETVESELRALCADAARRKALGRLSREYVEKYHSLDAFRHLFSAVQRRTEDRNYPLWKMYLPEKGEVLS